MIIYWFVQGAWFCVWLVWQRLAERPKRMRVHSSGRRCAVQLPRVRQARKPDWVRREIIRLKAWMPAEGCRKVAATFNRLHAVKRGMTVSKSFLADWLRRHRYEIEDLRTTWKRRVPSPVPVNQTWRLYLTGKMDVNGTTHSIMGIIDHGSRRALTLTALSNKSSVFLLRRLLDAIERFGMPRFIRTGRIERLFGTLKGKLDQWMVVNINELHVALGQFSAWYNHVRPHQHLGSQTPVEACNGIDPYANVPKQLYYFSAWDGLLRGFYLRQ